MRVLAESVGAKLGVGAHLVALRRTRAGDFRISDAMTLEALQKKVDDQEIGTALLSMDAALTRFPFVQLTETDANWTRNGRSIGIGSAIVATWSDGEKVRMRSESGDLIAVGFFDAGSRTLQPRVVIARE